MKDLLALQNNGKVLRVIEEIAFEWDKVAIQLNFTPAQIKNLQSNAAGKSNPIEAACCSMFEEWLGREPEATWTHLTTAIRNASSILANVALKIEQTLQ